MKKKKKTKQKQNNNTGKTSLKYMCPRDPQTDHFQNIICNEKHNLLTYFYSS